MATVPLGRQEVVVEGNTKLRRASFDEWDGSGARSMNMRSLVTRRERHDSSGAMHKFLCAAEVMKDGAGRHRPSKVSRGMEGRCVETAVVSERPCISMVASSACDPHGTVLFKGL